MAKVLVTGGSGFIGTHLVAALAARGDEVTCLVRKSSRMAPSARGARLLLGDVTDRESVAAAVAGQAIVYHLAGCTQALAPRHFYRVNQHGVANVARVCAGQTTPPVLVSVSSLAAAGPAATAGRRPRPTGRRPCRTTATASGRGSGPPKPSPTACPPPSSARPSSWANPTAWACRCSARLPASASTVAGA